MKKKFEIAVIIWFIIIICKIAGLLPFIPTWLILLPLWIVMAMIFIILFFIWFAINKWK